MSGLSQEQKRGLNEGIRQFNRREFHDCHETLEKVWMDYSEPDREVIQGIIQIAVGYYHLLRSNKEGSLKLLKRGVNRLKKFTPSRFKLDLKPFIAKVSKDISTLKGDADTPSSQFEIPRIEFICQSDDC